MPRRYTLIILVALVLVIVAVLLVRGAFDPAPSPTLPDNRLGPAEGGALETGGALDSDAGFRNLPARDMPETISEYPPEGPETDNPPPSQR